MDKRIGSFPFDQLATLAAAEKKLDTSSKNLLSRTELFYLINRHASTDKIGDALFLENPIDPEALQPSHDQKSQTVTTTISDTVKINPYSDDLELTVTSDKPRIGSKKTIEEYGKLANKFGFFENQERASLNIPSGLSFDAVINTARGTPATLANEFLEKLEKSKTSSHRISKL
jgi:hypothetical protein